MYSKYFYRNFYFIILNTLLSVQLLLWVIWWCQYGNSLNLFVWLWRTNFRCWYFRRWWVWVLQAKSINLPLEAVLNNSNKVHAPPEVYNVQVENMFHDGHGSMNVITSRCVKSVSWAVNLVRCARLQAIKLKHRPRLGWWFI